MNRRQFLYTVACAPLFGRAARAQYQPQARDLVARLQAAQAEDGAVLMPGADAERVCNPYFGNQAATGFVLGAPPRSRTAAQEFASRWMTWYVNHLNADGTIDDHRGAAGALKPTGKFDSSDAYAGTFLTLAGAYLDQFGDSKTVLAIYPQLQKIAEAALLTRQKSGLTHARPDYPVAYLMDNVEVWQGLDAFSRLGLVLRKKEDAARYRAKADALEEAIDRWFWSPSDGVYAWALHSDGKREGGLEKWYPQWMANLMALAYLPPSDRRDDLFSRLTKRFLTMAGAPVGAADPGRLDPKTPYKRSSLGALIRTTDQLEKVVWAGLAVVRRRDELLLEEVQLGLSKAPWSELKDLNPGLVGLALRVGGARATPE